MSIRTGIKSDFLNKSFITGLIIFISVFVFSRLPFFLYYPVVSVSFDSASYCAVALNILAGNHPLFDIRTPGYPIFLSAVIGIFSGDVFYVALFQSIFTLFCGIIFLTIINKVYRSYIILFSLMLSVYISSSYFIIYETALLSESIFVNLLLILTGILVLCIKKNKIEYWFTFSFLTGLILMIRPAGLFLIPLFAVVMFYFYKKKYGIKYYAVLLIPSALFILSLCTYNLFTVNSFSLTPFGNVNLPGVTITFMEPSDEYPPYVNKTIDSTLNLIPSKDKSYVKESFGISKLYNIFVNNYYTVVKFTDKLMKEDSEAGFISVIPVLKMVSMDAIKKHPGIYAKFFICNFIQYFRNISKSVYLYTDLIRIYKNIVKEEKHLKALESGEWQQVSTVKADNDKVINLYRQNISRTSGITMIENNDDNIRFKSSFLKSFYDAYETLYNFLFRNFIWIIIFALTLPAGIYLLFKNRFNTEDALIYTMLGLMYLSKAVMVSLVECSLERYSYTTEFVLYFSIPFLIMFIQKIKTQQ